MKAEFGPFAMDRKAEKNSTAVSTQEAGDIVKKILGNKVEFWRTWRWLCMVGLFVAALSASRSVAQMDQGAIVGVVTDGTGAAIPGAKLTLTNLDTGLILTGKSNGTGDYFFAPVKTGHYKLSAEMAGFETMVQADIVVHVTDRLNIPFKMMPGKVSETVTVTSAAPLMQTQTAEAAIDVDTKFLNDAPLANRNWVFIAQEAPGVTPFVGRGAGNGDFSSNGQHSEQNNYLLDGVDNNTVNTDYINGSGYNLAPPPDAISEFKIETSNYSAEIGRGHAAVINATTKSGTNGFHGSAWEYVRNTKLDALIWNQAKGSNPAVFHMNEFGGTFGGPIMKNHLFYFGDFEEKRFVNGANPSTFSVPTPRMRQGDFSELLNTTYTGGSCPQVLYVPNTNTGTYSCKSNTMQTGGAPTGSLQQFGNRVVTDSGPGNHTNYTFAPGQNVFAPAQLDPVAQNLLKLYPCPNYAPAGNANFGQPNGGWQTGNCNTETNLDSGPTSNNYQVNLNTRSDILNWDHRLDWNLSARDLATFRVDYQHVINKNTPPLGLILDGTGNNSGARQSYLSENYMLSETHTFSPTLINEFRFGFSYGNDANLQANATTNIAATLGLNGVPVNTSAQLGGLPSVSDGFTTFGTHGNDPAHEGQNNFQVFDNVTKVIGNHALKMGFAANPQRYYGSWVAQPLGSYSYNGQFTGFTGAGGPTGNAGADFLSLGTLPGGGYATTNNMASAQLSTYKYQHFVQKYFAGYMQDDWKVTHKLTLNLGLRYEYFTPKEEQSDQYSNFVGLTAQMTPNGAVGSAALVLPDSQMGVKFDSNLLALMQADHVVIQYTPNRFLSSFPKANWSPRIGAAYQITDRTVVRMGAGVFMGGFEPGGGAANLINPPFEMLANSPVLASCSQGNYCASQNSFGNTLEGGLGTFQGAGGIAHYASFPEIGEEDPVMRMPYTINYNLSVQRAITSTTTATVAYVGSLGRHLVTGLNNPAMPLAITIGGQDLHGLTTAPHFNPFFWMSWQGASSYNGLQATVQKHYGHGLSFLGTYTWAHAFSDTTDLLGGENTYKQAALIPPIKEWTQTGYDIRQRAVINVDYDFPFGVGRQFVNKPGFLDELIGGWKTDMEWWGQTGQPFTVGISRTGPWQNANGGLANSAVKIGDPYSNHLTAPDQSNPATASGMTTGTPSNTAANVCAAQTRTRQRWFNPCAFADPLGVMNTNNAAAATALAPYATGYFSYYSPAIGADNSLGAGAYNSNGTANANFPNGAPYVTGYANVKPFFGTTRNDVSGPGNWKLNASLFKDFKTFREHYLELRGDAFNVLNHPTFGQPGNTSTNIGANSVSLTGPGNNQTNTIDARFLQFSAKYVF
jgi:hypothetical protein